MPFKKKKKKAAKAPEPVSAPEPKPVKPATLTARELTVREFKKAQPNLPAPWCDECSRIAGRLVERVPESSDNPTHLCQVCRSFAFADLEGGEDA